MEPTGQGLPWRGRVGTGCGPSCGSPPPPGLSSPGPLADEGSVALGVQPAELTPPLSQNVQTGLPCYMHTWALPGGLAEKRPWNLHFPGPRKGSWRQGEKPSSQEKVEHPSQPPRAWNRSILAGGNKQSHREQGGACSLRDPRAQAASLGTPAGLCGSQEGGLGGWGGGLSEQRDKCQIRPSSFPLPCCPLTHTPHTHMCMYADTRSHTQSCAHTHRAHT